MDKQSSKSGGYAGGFFQLFDWKAKSRKKLFSSKSESPERAKQEKRSEGNLPMSCLYLMDEYKTGMDYASRGSGGFSFSSSVIDDDGLGSRGPSVVARLMGLDSMPTSICDEPYFYPFSDTQSLRDSQNLDSRHYQMMSSGNFPSKMEGPLRQTVEEKPQMQRPVSRPIEKFQTEVLPPKSAKSIPITQHRLLSPIKSPGFIPSRDAAHIMEAAAKIIDAGQHPTPITKRKMPMVVSSSGSGRIWDGKYQEKQPSHVLLRVQDTKEKTDTAQRTASRLGEVSVRSPDKDTSKCLKSSSFNKSWNGLETSSCCAAPNKEEALSSSRKSGKSISLAVQAKANVQKRGGMSLSERSIMSQTETGESKLGESFRSQSRASQNPQKRSCASNSYVVLSQNNQKQNCIVDKKKPLPEPSLPILPGREVSSIDSSSRPKTGNRSIGGPKVGSSLSSTKNTPRKKRSIEAELQLKKIHVRDDSNSDKNKKPVQSISQLNKIPARTEDTKKSGMDVVSFTFTAPLARTMPGSDTLGRVQKSANCLGKRAYPQVDNIRWPVVDNALGGDALSMLLEQKLRELSNEVGSSCHDTLSGQSSSSLASLFQDVTSSHTGTKSMQKLQDSKDGNISWPSSTTIASDFITDCFTTNAVSFELKNGIQEFDNDKYDDKSKQPDFRHPSPSSVLEPSFSAESCFSSESMDSNFIEGNKQSLAQAEDIVELSFHKKPHLVEADVNLFDSASSILTRRNVVRKHHTPTTSANAMSNSNWEIDYVKAILCNVELMFKDFTLGRSREIINPHLFEQLEGGKGFTKSASGDSRLARKVLFDCVSECMETRCKKFIGGGGESWANGLSMVRKKEWLAEDIYKEILNYRSSGDSMVDDLVDKDMRRPYGRWTDFEADAFVLGLEIGSDILDSLIEEAIAI